jgi:radical SAM superfamily enzyme YgiQ (UPF0313 family)
MYRSKTFVVRPLEDTLSDLSDARKKLGPGVEKIFIADGDALVMELSHWERLLIACREAFPGLRRVSAYATAMNLNEKTDAELVRLRDLGLEMLYIGPETGDDEIFRRIAKGANFADHVNAAKKARAAGIELSSIFLLGAGGIERSQEHAEASAKLVTEMDPEFVSLLTLTVVPGTPIAKLEERGKFQLPSVERMLEELRIIVDRARPTDAVFRTNHASNYLPLAGRLPRDRERIVAIVDQALGGGIRLRPEWARGL